MATKRSGCFRAILSVMFTGILAPVAVNLITTEVRPQEEHCPGPRAGHKGRHVPPARVIVQGVGWSPDEAVQDGFRKALAAEIAVLVAPAWAARGTALLDEVLRDGRGLIAAWREISAETSWVQGRPVQHRTLAVEVARPALRGRLRELGAIPAR